MINLYYVQANGDTFIRHIHDVEPTHWDEDNFCRVANLTPDRVERFGVHQLKLVTPPYFDPATQKREHGPALLIDGVWTQNYIVSDLTADEIEAMRPPIPQSVSMRQARLALLSYGLLDDVQAVIITMNEPQRSQTQIEWEYAQTVERDNALVAALGPALGLDDAAIDSLFTLAATL
jgi:hypothetical protein